jgi:hypothetical protein
VLFFLNLVQDFELLFPVIHKALTRDDFRVSVCVTASFSRRAERACENLKKLGVPLEVTGSASLFLGLKPALKGVDLLMTASESNAKPHRACFWLTRRSNRAGVKTWTMQHGFENIGLTYFDGEYEPGSVRFASQKILLWGSAERLHPGVSSDVRARCVSVGCPKTVQKTEPGAHGIGIFENLHWSRYSFSYRRAFLETLVDTARIFRDAAFWVKLHPDHDGFLKRALRSFSGLDHVKVIDPGETSEEFFSALEGVITTPSTVALDASRAHLPVAIAADERDLSSYRPLTLVRTPEDWAAFIHSTRENSTREALVRRSDEFVAQVLSPGPAVENILSRLKVEVGA